MGFSDSLKSALDQAKEKALDFADQHSDQIGAALDKVGDTADKATKGKYTDRIGTGRDKAKAALGNLTADQRASGAGAPPAEASAPTPGDSATPAPGEASRPGPGTGPGPRITGTGWTSSSGPADPPTG